VQQIVAYSITSSARASSVAGTSMPSALAVFRFITSSYLVGACIGRSGYTVTTWQQNLYLRLISTDLRQGDGRSFRNHAGLVTFHNKSLERRYGCSRIAAVGDDLETRLHAVECEIDDDVATVSALKVTDVWILGEDR